MRVPGPSTSQRFTALTDAYDRVMAAGCGPTFKDGSTTTRMSDLLSFSAIFDEVFLFAPLIEACSQFFGQDFKLSSFLGRTLKPGTPSQELHADLPRTSTEAPLLGFILMIDSFREENGATRFVPGSHKWPNLPSDSMADARAKHPDEILGCGEAGTMTIFDGAIWHGHTANVTLRERRSIQGYFSRRCAQQGFDFRMRLPEQAQARMTPIARRLLDLDQENDHPLK
jgi:ectoine hydroxylase-related dioxygenase (phytanoyl-CoA dioxygenase family)